MNDLHGILFAYHSDSNLGELTRPRNTCSLPFGGRYRLIDFMLSSYVNAGISDVGLIVHESYQSLLDHVGSGKDWDLSRKHGGLRILPPFGVAERGGSGEYRGNMEALAGIYTYLQNIRQEYVIMGWGDMVVNLPVAEVFQQHLDSGADITILCTQELKGAPRNTVYITQGPDGLVSDLSINPAHAANALESLETYIISKKLLLDMVDYCAAHNIHNFSRGVLLPRLSTLKVLPYLHRGYVARFQSVADYFQHSMDLLDPAVRADLFDPPHPDQGPVQPLHLLRPRRQISPLPGGGRLLHRGRGGKLHPLPRRHCGGRRQGLQQRPDAGDHHPRRCLPVLHHHRQECPGESGPDADGPLHLSAGHLQGFHRLIAGEAPDRTRGLPPR